ncbi:MAG: hypothetical protein ACXVCV_02310 [Polyangia bacterium]
MRAIFALAILLGGCARPGPMTDGGSGGEVVYLVHNQVWRIGLDGSGAARLGTVGDDPHRTAFPRRLADGRIGLLADDTGAIYPYVTDGHASLAIGATNVTLHDALCAVTVGGAGAIVYTVTPFSGGRAQLVRADFAAGDTRLVAAEPDGEVTEPAPWEDGSVLAVRSARGQVTLEILDVSGKGTRERIATIDAPYSAHAPARLPDGRVLYVRTDPRDSTDTAVGELFVLDRGGVARTTGITGVRALVVVGGAVVYEVGGADGVTDLVRTNLVDPPVNLTRTPTVAEHLGWSD